MVYQNKTACYLLQVKPMEEKVERPLVELTLVFEIGGLLLKIYWNFMNSM